MNQTSVSVQKVRILSEASIFIALTIVLKDLLPPLFQMPQGGSVSIAGLVPLLWFALRRGLKWGVFAGFVYGLIHAFLPGSYIIDPMQGLLDYPLAFAALGLAGFFRRIPVIGVVVGIVGTCTPFTFSVLLNAIGRLFKKLQSIELVCHRIFSLLKPV